MNRSDPLSAAVRPFRLRLGLFAVLRALLASFAAGCFSCGAAILACKIAQKSPGVLPPIAASAAAAAVFAAVLLYYFPSRRETARRIDGLGLKERASTMLAFRDDPSEIAFLQRNDALRRIDTVKKRDLRAGIGMLPVILAAVALLFAVLCAVIPASWFERAENPLDEVWQQVLEMLREEEGRLGEQGEDVLSDEMRDLIDSLEEMDPENVLRAVGEINGAQEAAKDAARNGEASREAMGEMLDVLEEARRALIGEEEEENGEGEEGGMQPGGEMEMEGLMPGMGEEGEEGMPMNPDGEPRDGENGMGRGNGEPGEDGVSLKTEPVYDPISGSVPYGDVFSAYYSEYLRDAEDGEIPFEVQEAAEAYFSSLDQ
jgi:hypothetical protein